MSKDMPFTPIYYDGSNASDFFMDGEYMNEKVQMDEQETIINIVPAQISKKAEVYSCIPAMVTRLKKLASTRPDAVRIVSEDSRSVTAEVDRSCIKISPKRIVPDEQRKAASERLAAARAKKVTS